MDRRARNLAAWLALATLGASGCARSRSALPVQPTTARPQSPSPAIAPVELTPLEPIRASINQGKIPEDPGMVRASYTAEDPPGSDGPPPIASQMPRSPRPRPTSPPRPAPAPNPAPAPEAAPAPAAPAPAEAGKDPIRLRTDADILPGKPAAQTAAMVDGTVITMRMLKTAICLRMEMSPGEMQQQLREMPKDKINEMCRSILDGLIDNALLLQEAQREMKKNWKQFSDYAERSWREKEMPRKLRKYDVADEISLRKKMEAQGESLDDVHDMYKQETMAKDFLMIRMQSKVIRPGKPEMEAYYFAHRNDPENHREARVVWREVFLAAEAPADMAKARASAAALRLRVARGEPFAAVAKGSSAGATASKGGLWETSPGSSPVPAINAALASLPLGQVSPPIDGPKGVYLVVVERRTAAGPASFVELQKPIAEALFREHFAAAVDVYLKSLRAKTTITLPAFQGAAAAPAVARDQAKVDADAMRTSGEK